MDSKVLLEYNQSIRSRYLEKLASLPWDKVIESRGASFDSLRNILLHTVDAEDMMVNYVIAGRRKDWMSRNPEEFHDMDSLRKRARDTESRTKAYLSKLTPTELDRKVDFSKPGMPPMLVRVEDILIHAVLENIHHFGELIALLWQMDVEPPHTGWLSYLDGK